MSAVVAESQLADALDVTTKAVQLRAVNEGWLAKTVTKQGGSERLYFRNLLPVDIREGLVAQESVTGRAGLPAVFYDTPVPKRSNAIGLAKYNLVHAFRIAKERAGWGQKGQAAEEFLLAYNAGVLLPRVFEQVGQIQLRTIEALDKKLLKADDNYLALCDGRGGWKKHGTTRYKGRELSETAKAVFLKCYLRQERNDVITSIRSTWLALEEMELDEKPGESTFRRWLKDYETYNAGVICLAREGEKAYKDKFARYITRDAELLEVGQCLVADGKTLNFTILHPETGRPCRMTLIVFFDWKSRYPMGWQIATTENQWVILAAFRNACMALGRYPDSVYLDNGRAFKAKLFKGAGLDLDFEEMTGLYARVGTAVFHAKPYNGRAKVVERFFKTFQEQLECHLPSFCGDSIQTKPAHLHRNEKYHQRLHALQTGGWVPTIREAAIIVEQYIRWYAVQLHTDLQFAPMDRFMVGRGPGIDPAQLHFDFLIPIELRVRRGRAILWGIEYEADAFDNLMINFEVTARVDTADLSRIWCWTKDGIYMGEAVPVRACHPIANLFGDKVSVEQVENQLKRQKRVIKNAKRQLTELAGLDAENQNPCLNVIDITMPAKQKVPILSGPDFNESQPQQSQTQAQEPVKIPEKEIKRLEAVFKKAEADMDNEPEIPRPKYWQSGLEHYEWCFKYIHQHGRKLDVVEAAFMDKFESLPEFEIYHPRFEDLKMVFNLN
ncbi:MAG: transposase family protein [Proteobacteria bacterium]|nr:transposase family protein [Pseudomonadota bacterium]